MHPSAWGLDSDITLHVGVERQNAKATLIALGLQHASFQCKRHHSSEHIAAIGRGVHAVFVGLQLDEQEVKVHTGHIAFTNDANFAGQGVCAAQAVNLPWIG